MMIRSTALITLLLFTLKPHPIQASTEVRAAEIVTRSFLTAVYQNDRAGARPWVVDASELDRFIGKETLDADAKESVRQEIEALQIRLAPGYEEFANTEDGTVLPMGAPLKFSLAYRGTPMAVSTVNTKDGWKVDLRWWTAMIKLREGVALAENHPKMIVRRYLFALMKQDMEELKRVVVNDYPIEDLYREDYKPPFEDQYYYLVIEMPLVEAQEGDLVPTRDGNLVQALARDSHDKLYIGLYWDTELHFRLIRDGDTYKVEPADHLIRIGL